MPQTLPSEEEFRNALAQMDQDTLNKILDTMAQEIKDNETRKQSAKNSFQIIFDPNSL